jgi:hypothetical protein
MVCQLYITIDLRPPQAFSRDLRPATIVYTVGQMKNFYLCSECDFFKLVTFKGTIRKFLNVVAAHIEGLRYPPYAYLTRSFRVNVPLTEENKLQNKIESCK